MRISRTISLGSSAEVNVSTKKSFAAMLRSPFGPTTLSSASRASKQAGKSPNGSACEAAPPIVPRLRTCGSPIWAAALLSNGSFFLSRSENSMSWWGGKRVVLDAECRRCTAAALVHRRPGGVGPRLADALGTQRVHRAGCDRRLELERRQVGRGRHQVIDQAAGSQLTGLVVHGF